MSHRPIREHASNPSAAVLKRRLELLGSVRRIMHAFDMHSRRLEASASGITLPQLLCLMAVTAEEGLTSREIAQRIHASASTLVGVLDRLEAKRLVTRVRDPRDRRKIHIRPTAEGRALVASAPSPFGAAFDRQLAELSVDRQEALMQDLTLVADMMDNGHAGS